MVGAKESIIGGGDLIQRRRTSDEQWFKDTVYQLKHKPIWEEKIKILKARIEEASPNCIACYSLTPVGTILSDQTGNLALKRTEWQKEIEEKQKAIDEINTAMNLLSDIQKTIIELRYFKDLRDWHIYDLSKIPVGKTLYYQLRDEAVRTIAKCLGFLQS